MNVNQIGFNNFKAFGEKMQTFTKKPITLVYGPNSIGKSSFLHSQLYLEYLRNFGQEFNLYKTNFAGDVLDLNGFENFIHKHDISRELKYEFKIQDVDTIARLLSDNYLKIKELTDKGLFEIKIDLELLDSKLDTYDKDNISTYKNKIQYIRHKRNIDITNTVYENIDSKNKKINQIRKNQETSLNTTLKLAYYLYKEIEEGDSDWLENINTEDFVQYKNIYIKEIEKLENSKDILDQAILLTKARNSEDIYKQLQFFEYLSNVSTIKLLITLSLKGEKLQPSLNYYIDNDIVFHTNKNIIDINDKHPLMEYIKGKVKAEDEVKDAQFTLRNMEIFGYSIMSQLLTKFTNVFGDVLYKRSCSSAIDVVRIRALSFLNNEGKQKTIQYFSPLRFYPERWELIEKIKIEKDVKKVLDRERNLITDMFQNIDSIFYRKPFIYLNIKFLRTLFQSHFMYDGINQILPKGMKLTPAGTNTAQNFWSKLIHSEQLQDKLNHWFIDNSKLQSKYKVQTREYDIEYFFLVKVFRKLFGLKPGIKKELYFLDLRTNTEVTPRDMGLGISQILPILLSSLASENTKVYIEQPELHLHPAIQAELADEFIRSSKENHNEFIIETHSEHLLLRVMKRMRHTAEDREDRDTSLDLRPDDVCLLYVDSDEESTYIRELRLSPGGKLLDHWPNGFFEEGFKERFS